MPRHRPVLGLGRALADQHHIAELTAPLGQPLAPWVGHRRPVRRQRCSSRHSAPGSGGTATDRGLMRHPHHRLLRTSQGSHPAICSGDQPRASLASTTNHHHPQPRLGHQLGRLGPLGPTEGGGVGGLGPIAAAATVSGQLPRPHRGGPSQPGRELPVRLPGGHAAADRFAFGHGETPRGRRRGVLLPPAAVEHTARTDGPRCPAGGRSGPATHLVATAPTPRLALLPIVPRTAPTTSSADPSVSAEVRQPPHETANDSATGGIVTDDSGATRPLLPILIAPTVR